MKTNCRMLAAMLGTLGLALSLAPNCAAQFLGGFQPRVTHSNWYSQPGRVRLLPAAFVPDGDEDRDRDKPGIVGFWHQRFISEGSSGIPDGTVVDDDLAQWHSDNTEIQNTKSRPPLSTNFCLGVWEQTGPRTFKLNHFPQLFDSTGTIFVGPAQIQAEITVSSDGKTYQGTFTLDEYDPSGQPLTPPVHVQGKVTGTRITVKSTIADIL